MKLRILFGMMLLAVSLISNPTRLFAHGEPEIKVTPDIVATGGVITVKGTTMGANEDFKISLEGLKFRADLGSAQSDANENLTAQFTVPNSAPAGDYQVKAVSEDGDATTADLTVTSAASETGTPSAEQSAEPSASPHEIPRSRTPFEVAGLVAVVVLSAGVGLFLLRMR